MSHTGSITVPFKSFYITQYALRSYYCAVSHRGWRSAEIIIILPGRRSVRYWSENYLLPLIPFPPLECANSSQITLLQKLWRNFSIGVENKLPGKFILSPSRKAPPKARRKGHFNGVAEFSICNWWWPQPDVLWTIVWIRSFQEKQFFSLPPQSTFSSVEVERIYLGYWAN